MRVPSVEFGKHSSAIIISSQSLLLLLSSDFPSSIKLLG